MTTTKCPFCAEEIQAQAKKCKHCGSWLEDRSDTLQPADMGNEAAVRAAVSPITTGAKVFYLTSMVVGYLLGNLLAGLGAFNIEEDLGPAVLILGILVIIYALVMECVLLHRLWKAIPSAQARTTPGQAVGFLFIPFYNFYWVFQAIWGWAVDFNRYASGRGLTQTRAPEGLGLTLSILTVWTAVPLLGQVAVLANLVILPLFFGKAIHNVNALARADTADGVPSKRSVGG